jgi:hypothetical protein
MYKDVSSNLTKNRFKNSILGKIKIKKSTINPFLNFLRLQKSKKLLFYRVDKEAYSLHPAPNNLDFLMDSLHL